MCAIQFFLYMFQTIYSLTSIREMYVFGWCTFVGSNNLCLFLSLSFPCFFNTMTHVSYSSSGTTTSILECFGFLNIWFPLIMILDAANPVLYFQFLHVVSYVIFPSVHWSPLRLCWHQFPLIYFFYHSAFDVNGQASLIVLLCDLLYSYVLLIHLIHHLFWFSMYHLFIF